MSRSGPPPPAMQAAVPARPSFLARPGLLLERETSLGVILMLPAGIILLAFMGYPFVLGIWLSLTDSMIGVPGTFIGLKNFSDLLTDSIFVQTTGNTFVYALGTVPVKAVLGLLLAILLNARMPFQNIVRAAVLLPWIVPTALSSLGWLMIYDGVLSPFSWLFMTWGWTSQKIPFLGDPTLAIISVMVANIWRGIPFFAVTILAGLQAVPSELHEAAAIDGASPWQRFLNVTVPVITGVTLIATLFSIIWTFADFQLIYVLTRGGPANSTHIFGTYAYQMGMSAAQIGVGAAIALYMFPILAFFAILLLVYLRREV
ncbi:MAG: sugar ABC transporter permease [Chloroflexi bacterium]|nr:sugar ABC transporter permease [Chloroflexota bacterium]MCL5110346.1 sugar ABC transporter permease [Chloroflexota bacterium]